jgi:hypothetical protein
LLFLLHYSPRTLCFQLLASNPNLSLLHRTLTLLPDQLEAYLAASGNQPFTFFVPSDSAMRYARACTAGRAA